MKTKRIISTLLAMLMVLSVFTVIPVASYAEEAVQTVPTYQQATSDALAQQYENAKEKIDNDPYMSLRLTCADYQLYCNPYTGEVIYYNLKTGQALSTNPYNMGTEGVISDSVKAELLSQVHIAYSGLDGNIKNMYSFTEAAQRGQIIVKNIKNGIRVQYTIGRENTAYLLPGWIMKEDLEEKILKPFEEYVQTVADEYGYASDEYVNINYQYTKLVSFYTLQNANEDSGKLPNVIAAIQKAFPITAEKNPDTDRFYEIYTIDNQIQDPAKNLLESYIKNYAPEYGYDDLNEDHAKTGYVASEETPPLFKVAIEYTINEQDGSLNVRVPANSIRYDETLFTLEYVSPLAYFGAGDMNEDGYIFYPDGSGALFDFSELYNADVKTKVSWSGKVYGQDYAYYQISGQHQSAIRLPVYGMITTNTEYEWKLNEWGDIVDIISIPKRGGFFAILEEGDALANIAVDTGAARHNYASVFTTYYPRPKDAYEIAGATASADPSENLWTVVSDRKYTGSYRTKIIMLTDEKIGSELVEAGTLDSYYSAESWVGMAKAYRDYLEQKGLLSRLTEDDVKADIPLYIESFGTIETIKKILSMPVTVDTPLTTFEDVQTMYNLLSGKEKIEVLATNEDGEVDNEIKSALEAALDKDGDGYVDEEYRATNVNFKLTGFANGGLVSTYPNKLKWQKAAGGAKGFRALVEYAKENDFGVYPDFEFSYIENRDTFDGVKLKELGARTVDNRYTSKRIYDAVYQSYTTNFELCVATNMIERYYDKFASKFAKYEPIGISVGTLGSDLNSNFDEDNPLTRDDSKKNVEELLKNIKDQFGSVMAEGGNIYAVQYVDHLLDIPLDASNYRYEAAAIPFMGMILHGYVNFTGTPLNESGDTSYNILKAIENGAALSYLLSYRNSTDMKQTGMWPQYYSIRYDIWFDEMLQQYNVVNNVLADLQTSIITDHRFLMGERIPNAQEELENDDILSLAIYDAVQNALTGKKDAKIKEYRAKYELYQQLKADNEVLKSLAASSKAKNLLISPAPTLEGFVEQNYASYSEEKRAEIIAAYTSGKDAEAFAIKTGLKVGVLADIDKIVASIKEFTGKDVTDAQLDEIYFIIAKNICTLDIEDTVLDIVNGKRIISERIELTQDKIYKMARLIVDGASVATLKAELGAILNEDIDETLVISDADIAEIAEAFKDCIYHGDEDVTVESVEIDYNFNRTDSEATDKENYVTTAYTLNDERLVMVTYSDKTATSGSTKTVSFVLNYNIFDVKVVLDGKTYIIPSYDFVRIDK
jgi:hypothetical protein